MKLRVPTELTDKQIEDFQRIYKKTFDEDISRDKAIEEGLSLIRLVAIVINKGDCISHHKKPSTSKGNPSQDKPAGC